MKGGKARLDYAHLEKNKEQGNVVEDATNPNGNVDGEG